MHLLKKECWLYFCLILSSTAFTHAEDWTLDSRELPSELLHMILDDLSVDDLVQCASCNKDLRDRVKSYAEEHHASRMNTLLSREFSDLCLEIKKRQRQSSLVLLSTFDESLPKVINSSYTSDQKLILVTALIESAALIRSREHLRLICDSLPFYLEKLNPRNNHSNTHIHRGKITPQTDHLLPGMIKILLKLSTDHIKLLATLFDEAMPLRVRQNIYAQIIEQLSNRSSKDLAAYCERAGHLLGRTKDREDKLCILLSLSTLSRKKMRKIKRNDHIKYVRLSITGHTSNNMLRDIAELQKLARKRETREKFVNRFAAASSSASSSAR